MLRTDILPPTTFNFNMEQFSNQRITPNWDYQEKMRGLILTISGKSSKPFCNQLFFKYLTLNNYT